MRYGLEFFPPLEMHEDEVLTYIEHQHVKVYEVVYENEHGVPFNAGGITAYCKFTTVDRALTWPKEIEINDAIVRFQHRGLYQCSSCN